VVTKRGVLGVIYIPSSSCFFSFPQQTWAREDKTSTTSTDDTFSTWTVRDSIQSNLCSEVAHWSLPGLLSVVSEIDCGTMVAVVAPMMLIVMHMIYACDSLIR
jgi:hypothetical protein